MKASSIGLLPLYLELYDNTSDSRRGVRERMIDYIGIIQGAFEKRGVDVSVAPVCRLEEEFAAAVSGFEQQSVDAIVTLHLAYSPSLESITALSQTYLPIIVLDTTPTDDFGPEQVPDEIMFNHGIHGVQDLCNLLIRRKKPFQIIAGHWQQSDVMDRAVACLRSVRLVTAMKSARVGRIGNAFKGMGDFAVPEDVLRQTIGIETIPFDRSDIVRYLPETGDPAVQEEIRRDRELFDTSGVSTEAHQQTARTCLTVRRWIEAKRLTAFSFNFLDLSTAYGLPTVPFLEASKAMSRGLGYAGEGDVLTAALVGTLASVYPDTTFTEMFCPDWRNNRIFLSHMGEMNLNLAAGRPVLQEMDFIYTDVANPLTAYARLKSGRALLIDLAPGPDQTFSLIVSPVTLVDPDKKDNFGSSIHGWMKHDLGTAGYLEAYSRAGGTHHNVLVYANAADEILQFARMMGWQAVWI